MPTDPAAQFLLLAYDEYDFRQSLKEKVKEPLHVNPATSVQRDHPHLTAPWSRLVRKRLPTPKNLSDPFRCNASRSNRKMRVANSSVSCGRATTPGQATFTTMVLIVKLG